MKNARQRSSATPLVGAYAALVLYASLYPFSGWRWPPGLAPAALAWLPRTNWQYGFDIASNLLGYLPLGALLLLALRRNGMRAGRALWLALALPAGLSYGCEVLQNFVPGRVPAREDLAMNALGSAAGVALAALALRLGLLDAWQALRSRWFARESAGALALLALWPFSLLFPLPLPLGLGQVGERLRETLADGLQGVPWADAAYRLLAVPPPPEMPLRLLSEALVIALGLLAPCLLAYAVMNRGWRRPVMTLGVLALGSGGMTLSTVLNFGPAHALGWLTSATLPGLGLGLALGLVAAVLPRRVAAGVGLVVLTGLAVGVAQAPADPYFAQNLQAWEQGRFVRFHGLAQWLGWLWPYAAMVSLLTRLAPREA